MPIVTRRWSESRRGQLASDRIAGIEDVDAESGDLAALLTRQGGLVRRPFQAIREARKARALTPLPVRIFRVPTATKKVQVERSRILAALRSYRVRVHIQRPVPGIPVVDASAFELRENFEHGLG